jgi:hypothetical protein
MTSIIETKAEKALILLFIVLIVLVILNTLGPLRFLSGPLGGFVAIVFIFGIWISGWLAFSQYKTRKYL